MYINLLLNRRGPVWACHWAPRPPPWARARGRGRRATPAGREACAARLPARTCHGQTRDTLSRVELQTNFRRVFKITVKVNTVKVM